MATDTGIVTIYDMENGGAPLQCHQIDAREFLGHSSGQWSASSESKKNTVGDAKPLDVGGDSGKAMQLKAETNKALVTMAQKAGVLDCERMKKAELVDALLKLEVEGQIEERPDNPKPGEQINGQGLPPVKEKNEE
jgi:hypothetical protein